MIPGRSRLDLIYSSKKEYIRELFDEKFRTIIKKVVDNVFGRRRRAGAPLRRLHAAAGADRVRPGRGRGARHLMAEAPTGTGKSIGYGVPATYHAGGGVSSRIVTSLQPLH